MVTREERSTAAPGGGRGTAATRSVRRRTVRRSTTQQVMDATGTATDGEDAGGDVEQSAATVTIPRQRPRPRPHPRPAPAAEPDPDEPDADEPGTDGSGADEPGADGPGKRAARGAGAARRATGGSGTPRRWQLVAGVLAVLLIAGVVAAGLLSRRWYDQRQLDDARQSALAAARQTTVNFVSISAPTVDRDLKRISDGATGQFKDEFTQDTAQVRAAVTANKVDSRGSVLRAAVVSANRRSAVVLVAVDATVKNTDSPDGRLSHYRIRVDLSRGASGRWLVAQLQFVG
jgi:Mce-associated membrane protein